MAVGLSTMWFYFAKCFPCRMLPTDLTDLLQMRCLLGIGNGLVLSYSTTNFDQNRSIYEDADSMVSIMVNFSLRLKWPPSAVIAQISEIGRSGLGSRVDIHSWSYASSAILAFFSSFHIKLHVWGSALFCEL